MKNIDVAREIERVKKNFLNNQDLIVKTFFVAGKKAALLFLDELANQEEINKNILRPLLQVKQKDFSFDALAEKVLPFCVVEILQKSEIDEKILRGFCILVVEGEKDFLCFNTVLQQGRGVEEPPTSTVLSGPREGFVESIKTNLGLIRKRVVSNTLKIEDMVVGKRSKTKIQIVYFADIADKRVVNEVKSKLKHYEIDGVIDSYYVTKFLENRPNSIFRQVGNTEKPDICVAKMLEGRVVILVDGSPAALTVPYLLFEDFQSANDYFSDSHRVSMLRILRLLGLVIAIFLPGMYIALQLYHYKVLPLKFLVTIVNTTQNLPLNPFLEIFFIIVLFDILFEASVRMPKYLGMAISIVGALILGDTAVKAGLVSPPGVMIVALSAMTVYIIPNQSSQISLLRLVFAVIGGTLGFHGMVLGTVFLVAYLCNFDSFHTPYFAPFVPHIKDDQKDFVLKESLVRMSTRPKSIPHNDKIRLVNKGKEDIK